MLLSNNWLTTSSADGKQHVFWSCLLDSNILWHIFRSLIHTKVVFTGKLRVNKHGLHVQFICSCKTFLILVEPGCGGLNFFFFFWYFFSLSCRGDFRFQGEFNVNFWAQLSYFESSNLSFSNTILKFQILVWRTSSVFRRKKLSLWGLQSCRNLDNYWHRSWTKMNILYIKPFLLRTHIFRSRKIFNSFILLR